MRLVAAPSRYSPPPFIGLGDVDEMLLIKGICYLFLVLQPKKNPNPCDKTVLKNPNPCDKTVLKNPNPCDKTVLKNPNPCDKSSKKS
jgi:hypothetical protein